MLQRFGKALMDSAAHLDYRLQRLVFMALKNRIVDGIDAARLRHSRIEAHARIPRLVLQERVDAVFPDPM